MTDFLRAVIREDADELTLRAHEESVLRTFVDTTNLRNKKWKSLLDDAD